MDPRVIPAYLAGRVRGGTAPIGGIALAIAINGTIEAATQTNNAGEFAAFVPEDTVRRDSPLVELFAYTRRGDGYELERIPVEAPPVR